MRRPLPPMLKAPNGDLFGVGCVVAYSPPGSLTTRVVLVDEIDELLEGVEPGFAGRAFDPDSGRVTAAVWGWARQVFHVEQGPFEDLDEAVELTRHVWG